MLASIDEDLAEDGFHFVQHHDFAGRLNDLKWLRQQIGMGHSIGQALQVVTDDSWLAALSQDFPPCGSKRFLARLEIRQDVPEVLGIWGFAQSVQARSSGLGLDLPDSRKVGVAVD